MSVDHITPFELERDGQTREQKLAASIRCARSVAFYARTLPELEIETMADLEALPFLSRVDLSMAEHLGELILDQSKILRSTYPFYQNVCSFPYQVVSGEQDLYARHERMKEMFASTGLTGCTEMLVLTSPPQFFFASDFCAELLFEKNHCCLQNIQGLDPSALKERIEVFAPEVLVLATSDQKVTPALVPDSVKAIITFRGAYPAMAELDVTLVDNYGLTEAPYLAHRRGAERLYRFDPDQFHLERTPSGHLAVTTLLWEVMPLIRYQTYDLCGEIDNQEGLIEVLGMNDW